MFGAQTRLNFGLIDCHVGGGEDSGTAGGKGNKRRPLDLSPILLLDAKSCTVNHCGTLSLAGQPRWIAA